MGIGTGIAIYFIIWWTTLFITLPFRLSSQAETGEVDPGTEPAAPAKINLRQRMIYNTILAGAVFALYWFVVYYLGIGVDDLPEIIPIRQPD